MTDESLTKLVRWYEASEEASTGARAESEQARDYYDGKQLSEEEKKVLRRRKQPEVVKNRIKRKIDYLRGLERQGRTDPKAYPRTAQHAQDADAITDALRYVAADQNVDVKRSQVFENMLIEGFGGVECIVKEVRGGVIDPHIPVIPWDRLFFDPHSSAHDFSDARYLGFITWMDVDEAKTKWPDKDEVIAQTVEKPNSSNTDTYDDKPRWSQWADAKRKRIRVVTMYYIEGDTWNRCEFTLAGHLTDPGPSPYLDEDGKPECALILASAYVDRDNDRYSIVRDMIPVQDELNKRGSKALHLLMSRQVRVSPASGLQIDAVKRELAKPDGVIMAEKGDVEILPNGDFVAGHFQLMQEAKLELDGMGPNATMQGKDSQDASGRAILALQQGGMVEMAPLMDNLRHFNIRLFRQIWNRIRQFWTAERWVRVTDDDKNVRFVGLNTTKVKLAAMKIKSALDAGEIDEATAQQYAQQAAMMPDAMQPANQVAELDVDIDIDEVNHSPTLEAEQFQMIAELAGRLPPGVIPPEAIIEAMPGLRTKDKLLKAMEQAKAQPNPAQELGQAKAVADIEGVQAKTALTAAQTQTEQFKPQIEMVKASQPPAQPAFAA